MWPFKKNKKIPSFLQLELEREISLNKTKQQFEDRQYEKDVLDYAIEYINQELIRPSYSLIVIQPKRFSYMVYDDESAKYKNANFNALAKQKIAELKQKVDTTHKQK